MAYTHVEKPEYTAPSMVASNGRHIYHAGGKEYFSASLVINTFPQDAKERWHANLRARGINPEDEQRNTLKIGTEFHHHIETHLRNRSEVIPRRISRLFHGIKPYLGRIDFILALESPLVSHNLQLGGTVDCIAEYDGVRSVIDFKSTKMMKPREYIGNYFAQATAYSLMWEELTGEAIQQVVILMADREGRGEAFVEKREEWIDLLDQRIREFREGDME